MKRLSAISILGCAIASAFAQSSPWLDIAGVFESFEDKPASSINLEGIFDSDDKLNLDGLFYDAVNFDGIFDSDDRLNLDGIFDYAVNLDGIFDYDNRVNLDGIFDYPGNQQYSTSGGYLTTVGPNYNGSVHSAIMPGSAVLPVSGMITSRFGYRPRFRRMHKGIDIAVHVGDTIAAAMDGTVSRVDNDPKGYGIYICLRHDNGMETRYGHLSGTLVFTGARVAAGQPIALGGNTGNSTGPHLHFETRVNGTAIDPARMFDFSKPAFKATPWNASPADNYGIADYQVTNTNNGSGQSAAAAYTKSTYVVRIGDTMETVSRQTGVPVLKLCNLNMLSVGESLQPGRMLRLR